MSHFGVSALAANQGDRICGQKGEPLELLGFARVGVTGGAVQKQDKGKIDETGAHIYGVIRRNQRFFQRGLTPDHPSAAHLRVLRERWVRRTCSDLISSGGVR